MCVRVVLVLAGLFAFSLWPVARYSFVVLQRMPWVFRSSFVRFESIKKLLHFVSEARKTGGSIIRYKKLKLKLCLTISLFGDSGHNPGIARSRAQYPPRYFGVGVESLLSTHEFTEEPKQSS